ncbi:MAG TPA: flagellar hook-associated protein FlgK [Candidatus Hydrogenedentes bacterium]|nr:flagellar hook-associated protein FlgK [Candidatus Hydrogenedentota bacterium]
MGTLFSALDIGRAGMLAAQVQLDTTGHNIANVNRAGYSRQRVELTTRMPNYKPYGAIGRGPAIDSITRLRDVFVDTMYRNQVPGLGSAEIQSGYFSQIEDIFQEPSDTGFSSRMESFFDSLNDFSNNVEEISGRVATLAEAVSLAASFNDMADRLNALRTNANEEVRNTVEEINSLTERIAALNLTIRNSELGGRPANDLRDERDLLIDELSKIVKVTSRERTDGTIDVLLGGAELVYGTNRRELTAVVDSSLDPDRPDLLQVRFADNNQAALITDGELFGVLKIRDEELPSVMERMDVIAHTLIESINNIHCQSNGLENYSEAVTSTNAVISPYAPLNMAQLPFTVQDGSFDLVVYDSTGAVAETITVTIDATTTAADIESAINSSSHMSALVGADGLLTITPESGYSFVFSNDTSGALTALGINGFFTGHSAATISVNEYLADHPELLGSGFSLDLLETGDNSAALLMAELRAANLFENDTQTPNQYYESTIVEIGVASKGNLAILDVEEAFVQDYNNRRQEVSGVNIDEEVTSLVQFQRAFEASARIITVADSMIETLINVIR